MAKQLINSAIERQNILNNKYALGNIEKAIGYKGFIFEEEIKYTKNDISRFFNINPRTLNRYIKKYNHELNKNGYEILTGKRLKDAINALRHDTNAIPKINTINSLGIFNFRAFLNIAMLLAENERAKEVRSIILDIVIDTINERTGGQTKYINQRDQNYIFSVFNGALYRSQFKEALDKYVDMGNIKYPIYTNKIYQSIFKENTAEYRKILSLEKEENVRETMYSEVLDLISSYEAGFAEMLQQKSNELNRKLQLNEVDELFNFFEGQKAFEPLKIQARRKMASRDKGFRDVLHDNLNEYITPLYEEDFEKFLGEKSKSLEEQLNELKDVFIRLSKK